MAEKRDQIRLQLAGRRALMRVMERGLVNIATPIATAHHITLLELVGHERSTHIVAARVEFWAKLREMGWSYPRIGDLVDRDHTSIMKTLRSHGRYVPMEPSHA
jgi:chromosomal replication initiation ATPase DnaA